MYYHYFHKTNSHRITEYGQFDTFKTSLPGAIILRILHMRLIKPVETKVGRPIQIVKKGIIDGKTFNNSKP